MARANDEFRQSDATAWGLVALACSGLAIFGGNVAALLPHATLTGLHKPRFEASNLTALGQEMRDLRDETARLRRENETLLTRFALQEQARDEVTRRVGALEVSLPALLDLPANAVGIDRASVTAAIGAPTGDVLPADGGSLVVRQTPLQQALTAQETSQPLPAPIIGNAPAPMNVEPFGVILGTSVTPGQVDVQWHDLQVRLGSLLMGLEPRIGETGNSETVQIIAGPLTALADATQLCERLEQVAVACQPTPFAGAPLTP